MKKKLTQPSMTAGNSVSNLMRAASRFTSRTGLIFDGHGAPSGLSSARWRVLAPLRAEGPKTVPQLARQYGMVRQGVQRIVNELAADGLVELRTNPDHKRAKLVAISQKGLAKMAETYKRHAQWAEELAEGFDTNDLMRAAEVLDQLRRKAESLDT